MFTDGTNVIHFKTPKVQAALQGHTYVVTGKPENKSMSLRLVCCLFLFAPALSFTHKRTRTAIQDLLPGIVPQLGSDTMSRLKDVYKQFEAADGADDVPSLAAGNFEDAANTDSDDDIPELEDSNA